MGERITDKEVRHIIEQMRLLGNLLGRKKGDTRYVESVYYKLDTLVSAGKIDKLMEMYGRLAFLCKDIAKDGEIDRILNAIEKIYLLDRINLERVLLAFLEGYFEGKKVKEAVDFLMNEKIEEVKE